MDLTLGVEQEAVRDAIRGVLADRQPPARVRQVMGGEPPVDQDLWRDAAGLGWFGLSVPEAAGGAGYGVPEAMLLFQELGRAVAPGPWLGTVLMARALAGMPSGRTLLGELLAGRHLVAVVDDPADALGAGTTLDGASGFVLDAAGADLVLILGRDRVAAVGAGERGVALESAPSMDPTRRIGRLTAAGAPVIVLGRDAACRRREGAIFVAAEALGVAERTLELSVEYAKVRRQFGRPIGTFQAIKHRCADMAVRAEVARSSVTYAAVALDEEGGGALRHVAMAKALAGSAAIANATDNVQNHGGMGYTWESDAHLYLKRARLLEHCFGTRTAHLDALAAPWRVPS